MGKKATTNLNKRIAGELMSDREWIGDEAKLEALQKAWAAYNEGNPNALTYNNVDALRSLALVEAQLADVRADNRNIAYFQQLAGRIGVFFDLVTYDPKSPC